MLPIVGSMVAVVLVMVASTVDMLLPGVQLLPEVVWAGILLLGGLLVLLRRGKRIELAFEAAGFILMAAMWLVDASAGAAHPLAVLPVHHGLTIAAAPVLVVAALGYLAGRLALCLRRASRTSVTGWGHAAMAATMLVMTFVMAG